MDLVVVTEVESQLCTVSMLIWRKKEVRVPYPSARISAAAFQSVHDVLRASRIGAADGEDIMASAI